MHLVCGGMLIVFKNLKMCFATIMMVLDFTVGGVCVDFRFLFVV